MESKGGNTYQLLLMFSLKKKKERGGEIAGLENI